MIEIVIQSVLLAQHLHLRAAEEEVQLAHHGLLVDLPRYLLPKVDVVRIGLYHHRLEHGQWVSVLRGLRRRL